MISILVIVITLKIIGDLMQYLQLYGLNGVSDVMPLPIIATINPAVSNKDAVFGQQWINKTTGNVFVFGGTLAENAIWVSIGGAATFSSITVTGPATSSIDGELNINTATGDDTNIAAGASTGNVAILSGTGTGTVTIGNDAAGAVAIDTSADLTLGANATLVAIGSDAGTTDIRLYSFKAVADAGTSANAAFTANAGIVTVAISNLNTASAASGTITMTNDTVSATSGALITATITGAGDVGFVLGKVVPGVGTMTIDYTNDGGDGFNGGNVLYLSVMVVS